MTCTLLSFANILVILSPLKGILNTNLEASASLSYGSSGKFITLLGFSGFFYSSGFGSSTLCDYAMFWKSLLDYTTSLFEKTASVWALFLAGI